jgi:hypothetical protein
MIAIGLHFCPHAVRLLQAATCGKLDVLRQRAPRRPHLRWADRALFIWLYRRCPRILSAIIIVRPETVLLSENLILVDYVTESPNVNGDDRAALLLPDPAHLAVQVQEPT